MTAFYPGNLTLVYQGSVTGMNLFGIKAGAHMEAETETAMS